MSGPIGIAVFGSTARGDHDTLSDGDILLVANRPTDTLEAQAELRGSGWHPTFYTWDRLRMASEGGDLFVSHLQREAIIRKDPDHRLTEILSAFRPLASYKGRIAKSAEVLHALACVPDSPRALLWALDVAAVAYRSLAVSTLAEEGIHSFSRCELNAGLVRIGRLGASEPDPYIELRRAKWLYRRRNTSPSLTVHDVIGLLAKLDRVFALGAHFKVSSPERFVAESLGTSHPVRGWYARSRRLEGVLLHLASPDEEERHLLQTIGSKLLPPGDYGGSIATGCAGWESQILRRVHAGSIRLSDLPQAA